MQQFSHFQYLRLQNLDILVDLELSLKLQLKRGSLKIQTRHHINQEHTVYVA